jgi:hypothetical protein
MEATNITYTVLPTEVFFHGPSPSPHVTQRKYHILKLQTKVHTQIKYESGWSRIHNSGREGGAMSSHGIVILLCIVILMVALRAGNIEQ